LYFLSDENERKSEKNREKKKLIPSTQLKMKLNENLFLLLNMGSEMLYILDQRLVAQVSDSPPLITLSPLN